MIKLSQVTKIYELKDSTVTAVKNVDMNINKGQIFGIIGYSGAGKSTLIRLLNGLETPTKGTIMVANREINHISGRELRKARQEIGMIFQHFNLLWSRTVEENISFPLEIAGMSKKERSKIVKELIKLVGLEGREKAYPSQLSGGQKQRVGIARALANKPKVLLCDEATSALDPQTTDSILELLVDINQKLGLTIVLITHEMHVIRKICHRVAVMEDGEVVEEGNVLDVFENPEQPMTKRFVNQVIEPESSNEMIENLLSQHPEGKVIQLTFVGDTAEMPLITNVIRKFDVNFNILQGKVSQTHGGAVGTMFVHVDGDIKEVEQAIQYIRQQKVKAEVLSHE
ncbi:methionine ABC transporter ATP-binding protein [Chengkuizengella axinellae]|uniref:Methionine ABC transporter ATP-binding protein n=1 Tax=Chengkuizengella axinellae TaxID=3064388 RepID=A0ABT9J1C0_9BACL|nr:methionine ABC transporter ATP-binding protein [Chengkuizengella sp. 2205SS18-9]MDP5275373.1 methionine ABC transporter ATP-binding protein [Chengkuizengella sp. 2205SS18-9]